MSMSMHGRIISTVLLIISSILSISLAVPSPRCLDESRHSFGSLGIYPAIIFLPKYFAASFFMYLYVISVTLLIIKPAIMLSQTSSMKPFITASTDAEQPPPFTIRSTGVSVFTAIS